MPVGGGAAPDRNIIGVRLKEGANQFLVKVTSFESGWWRLLFRVSDAKGDPLPGVRYALPGASPATQKAQ